MKYQNILSAIIVAASFSALAEDPYKIVLSSQTMGTGRIDYVSADSDARRVYIPRGNEIQIFNLDTLQPAGVITNSGGHGVAIDAKSHHGFSSSTPVTMFDTESLQVIKKIPTKGGPDGIMFEPFSGKVFVLSHGEPNVTVIDPADGSITGTIDLGGAPEQGQSDGAGHAYIDLEDKGSIAVVDTKEMKLTGTYSLGQGDGAAGLGFDVKNNILFAMCREPQPNCVILSATDGKIITTLPLAGGSDGGGFNPATMEAFSSHGNGTLTIIKENSPTSFEAEPTVTTKSGAKTCSLDTKLNHIIVATIEPAPMPGASTNTPPANVQGGRRGGRGGGRGYLDVIAIGRQ